MGGWQRLRAWFQPYQSGDRLRVIPVICVFAGMHLTVVTSYLVFEWDRLEFRNPNPVDFAFKMAFSFVLPVILWLLWRGSRRSRFAVAVFDWFGGGLAALSTAMTAGLPDNLLRTNLLGPVGEFLLSFTWPIWGLASVSLLLMGMYQLSRELFSERLERQRLEALMEFTRRMSTLDYQTLLDEAVTHLYRVLRADASVLYLWNDEEQVLVPVAGYHDPGVYAQAYVDRVMNFKCPLGYGITGWVMQTGEPFISGNVMADPHSQSVPGWAREHKSSLLAPICIEGRTLGVMRLTRQGLNQFTQDDLDLALSFAGQAAMVIEHGRIVRELSELSITDSLTDLYNARHFYHVLAVETSRVERGGGFMALLMIDSDSLKERNDRLGHQEGDAFLRQIGRVLQENTRLVDYAFRYAGDEFLVLLPGAGSEQAMVVAERIRRTIQEREAALGLDGTVSIGVAILPLHATKGEGLLSAADRAMYAAKRAGKNQVMLAERVGSFPGQA